MNTLGSDKASQTFSGRPRFSKPITRVTGICKGEAANVVKLLLSHRLNEVLWV